MKDIYCFRRLGTVLESPNLMRSYEILFSASASFCMFLCSKGHSIWAPNLDSILIRTLLQSMIELSCTSQAKFLYWIIVGCQCCSFIFFEKATKLVLTNLRWRFCQKNLPFSENLNFTRLQRPAVSNLVTKTSNFCPT